MVSKYHLKSNSIYIKDTDIPYNKLGINNPEELNGRITRLFFDMIAISNGYSYIDYSNISPETYINASIECVQFANSYAMEKIIANGLK